MSTLQIKKIKDRKNELEIEFSERFFKKVNDGWLKSEKGLFYKDVSSKELPEVLKTILLKRGVNAYAHEPHPLIPGYNLNISGAKNPKKELKNALSEVEKNWNEFRLLLEKKLKYK